MDRRHFGAGALTCSQDVSCGSTKCVWEFGSQAEGPGSGSGFCDRSLAVLLAVPRTLLALSVTLLASACAEAPDGGIEWTFRKPPGSRELSFRSSRQVLSRQREGLSRGRVPARLVGREIRREIVEWRARTILVPSQDPVKGVPTKLVAEPTRIPRVVPKLPHVKQIEKADIGREGVREAREVGQA